VDPARSRVADRLGFALLPGEKDAGGTLRRHFSVGGQGISVSTYSRHQEDAWKFLEWFMSADTQWKWVRGGGQTGRVDILGRPEYTSATPYNALFPQAMRQVKDYWHLVEYPTLLAAYQRHVHAALTGRIPPKDALDRVAREHDALLRAGGQ
jgi:multiple sugar transport system substrate-binding protein